MIVDLMVAYFKSYVTCFINKNVISLVTSTLNLFNNSLKDYVGALPKDFELVIDSLILYSIIWGMAAAVDEENKKKMSEFILKIIRATADIQNSYYLKLELPYEPFIIQMKMPECANKSISLFDIYFDK